MAIIVPKVAAIGYLLIAVLTITIRHRGLAEPTVCANTAVGWETSLARLAQMLADGAAPTDLYDCTGKGSRKN